MPEYKNKLSIILIICIICFYFTMKLISCVWFVSKLGSKRESVRTNSGRAEFRWSND